MPGEDLGITEWNAGVEGVGDRGVAQPVRTDVARDAGRLGDPDNHSVDVASINRSTRDRAQDERAGGAVSSARLEHPQDRDGERHRRGLVALPDQVQDTVATKGLAVVLDTYGGCLGGSQRVDAEQVGQRAVVDGDGLRDLEESDQLEPVEPLGAGLVAVDLGEPGVYPAGSETIRPSTWANRRTLAQRASS
jgi:hypothetical protein